MNTPFYPTPADIHINPVMPDLDPALGPDHVLCAIVALEASPDTTEAEVGALLGAYGDAKILATDAAAPWEAVQAAARTKLGEIIAATGRLDWTTSAGRAFVPSAGVSVSYDAKALDALCKSSPELAAVLLPHRKETQRAGSLTIKGRN